MKKPVDQLIAGDRVRLETRFVQMAGTWTVVDRPPDVPDRFLAFRCPPFRGAAERTCLIDKQALYWQGEALPLVEPPGSCGHEEPA